MDKKCKAIENWHNVIKFTEGEQFIFRENNSNYKVKGTSRVGEFIYPTSLKPRVEIRNNVNMTLRRYAFFTFYIFIEWWIML